MAGVRQLCQGGFDVVPAPLILKSTLNQFGDEGASTAGTGTLVEFGDQGVWQCYVYSHGPNLAHNGVATQKTKSLEDDAEQRRRDEQQSAQDVATHAIENRWQTRPGQPPIGQCSTATSVMGLLQRMSVESSTANAVA